MTWRRLLPISTRILRRAPRGALLRGPPLIRSFPLQNPRGPLRRMGASYQEGPPKSKGGTPPSAGSMKWRDSCSSSSSCCCCSCSCCMTAAPPVALEGGLRGLAPGKGRGTAGLHELLLKQQQQLLLLLQVQQEQEAAAAAVVAATCHGRRYIRAPFKCLLQIQRGSSNSSNSNSSSSSNVILG